MKAKSNAGFTLLELMIVMEIISVLAALAIPALLRQRIQTNEATAVSNLRCIVTAQISYNTVFLTYGTFQDLTRATGRAGAFLDGTWFEGIAKNEYVYSMESTGADKFTVVARPMTAGRSGIRTFSADESGNIRW